MVVDLGRDYYHMSELELDGLAQKVRRGDMEEVLRLYEKEMKVRRVTRSVWGAADKIRAQ
jgi:nuclear-control-of-ATPase protein 2